LSTQLRLYIIATVAAASLLLAAALLFWPIRPEIGGTAGIAFWCLLTFVASALPVRLPRGVHVTVAFAPATAAMLLGGPAAAGIVAILGTIDFRELRGRVPWYGILNDHACFAIAAISSAMLLEWLLAAIGDPVASPRSSVASFAAFVVAASLYFVINNLLSVTVVHLRTGTPLWVVWAEDIGGIVVSLIALAPVGWLMAQTFQLPSGIGWWATPLFVVPLFSTRLAYARYVETRELFEQTIEALSKAVDARDPYTRNHSSRVSHIAEAMSRVMRLPEREIERIKWAGLLHDIGKIGIRDNILLKEGPLDKHERILMNQHPTIGAEIVAPATQLAPEAPLIRAHHEWINGSGYPDGLEALDIPVGARIMTIADAYEAMSSSRPYRKLPLTHEQAVDQLEKFSGIQFDPEIVPILIGLDRSILDRPPDRPDELPTMLQRPDPRDTPKDADGAGDNVAASTTLKPEPTTRPALASDDVS
jgi:putative nucleotidyltransferase with HDIG domain